MTAQKGDNGEAATAGRANKSGTLIFSGLPSFMKAPWVACEVEALREIEAKAVFLGMPFDQATAFRSGESYGPKALRNISEQYLPYLGEFDVDLVDDLRLIDGGDVPVVPANPARSRDLIEEYVGRIPRCRCAAAPVRRRPLLSDSGIACADGSRGGQGWLPVRRRAPGCGARPTGGAVHQLVDRVESPRGPEGRPTQRGADRYPRSAQPD